MRPERPGVYHKPPAMTSQQIWAGASQCAIAVDDDTNASSGDIFTQNAQDQSTA
jgi:hypothetical protein